MVRAVAAHLTWVVATCVAVASCGAPASVKLTPDDPALRAQGQVAVDQILPAYQRCRALIVTLPDSGGMPADATPVRAACGDAATLYDRLADGLLGKSIAVDILLNDTARLGDDLDYLLRTLDTERPANATAVAHVKASVAALDGRLAQWPQTTVTPYSGQVATNQWALAVRNDEVNGTGLQGHLDRYAFQQGLERVHVRARLLDGFGRMVATPVAIRAAALEGAALPDAEKAARKTYLDAYGHLLSTYASVTRRYTAGEITDEAKRGEAIAEADAAFKVWQAAWDVESARTAASP